VAPGVHSDWPALLGVAHRPAAGSSKVRNTDRFRRIMTREQPSVGPQARTVGSGQGDAVAETGTVCGRLSIRWRDPITRPKIPQV
jgi:hypothetical protein